MTHPPQSASQRRRPGSQALTAALALLATAAGCFGVPMSLRATPPESASSAVNDQRPVVSHDLFANAARVPTAVLTDPSATHH